MSRAWTGVQLFRSDDNSIIFHQNGQSHTAHHLQPIRDSRFVIDWSANRGLDALRFIRFGTGQMSRPKYLATGKLIPQARASAFRWKAALVLAFTVFFLFRSNAEADD